jgi:phosphinothricin acetyltransferase
MIRPGQASDGEAIARIYNYYVRNTVITFEEEPVTALQIAERMSAIRALGLPWLVEEEGGRIAGYAYANRWMARSAYRFSIESTVYLDAGATGRGLGSALYRELLSALQGTDVRAVVAGIALPNPESVALHEKLGFEKVAHFKEVGFKLGRWIDVGFWQRVL